MIVLRWTLGAESRELRSPKSRLVLGTGPNSDLRLEDAGWAPTEAILRHAGTAVLLARRGLKQPVAVRVGDVVHLGRARVSLVGLLPPETAPGAPTAGAAAAGAGVGAGAVEFGGYEDASRPSVLEPSAAGATVPPSFPPADRTGVTTTPAVDSPEDFADAVLAVVRRVPFYFASAVLHGLLLLVFLMTLETTEPVERTNQLRWAGEMAESTPAEVESSQSTTLEEPAALPEPVLTPPEIADTLENQESVTTPVKPDPAAGLPDPEPVEPTSLAIGVRPSLSAAGARTPRRSSAAQKQDMKEVFSEQTAGAANDKAAGMVRKRLGIGGGGRGTALEDLEKIDILVVDGAFDRMGQTLDALKLPYLLVSPFALSQPSAPSLDRHKVVFYNCGESLPKRHQTIVAKRLKDYVEQGGYLFTTDWAIENVIALAFPGYLSTKGRTTQLPETVVEIQPVAEQRANPLLDGVFVPGTRGRWWLEQASFDIDVLRPREVTVLIESPTLREIYGRSGAVAVTFNPGRGRVLHVMGHYYQKAGNIAGTVAAQHLALNFVLQRMDQAK